MSKIANTPALIAMVETSRQRRYNRLLAPAVIKKLDPSGIHVFTWPMLHEKGGSGKAAVSVRVLSFIKLEGKDEPYETQLDFDVAQYNALAEVKEGNAS